MKINITAGEILNGMLLAKYSKEQFIPFNEAMIVGTYTAPLFSTAFIEERAITHNVSVDEYTSKLAGFLEVLDNIERYDQIVLWFGDEPFCSANTKVVLQALKDRGYKGSLILNIVEEETTKLVKSEVLQ